MIPPTRRMVNAVARAITRASLGTPTAQARAALAAAERYIEQREAEAVQAERMSILYGRQTTAARAERVSVNVTIATRERFARREMHREAVEVCQRIVQERYAARRMAECNGARACVEAVRALLPELDE